MKRLEHAVYWSDGSTDCVSLICEDWREEGSSKEAMDRTGTKSIKPNENHFRMGVQTALVRFAKHI
jgi:hypothetical protein